ncbi:hypothetical protein ABK040_014380 [Willaertia magna]
MSSSTENDDKKDLIKPVQGGTNGPNNLYRWTQDISSIMMVIPFENGITSKQVKVTFQSKRLKVQIVGQDTPLIDGELNKEIDEDESYWQIEDKKELLIHLQKTVGTWWECVIEGHPRVNTMLIDPPQASLSELGPEMRQTVEKMLFEQAMKNGTMSEDQIRDYNIRKLKQMHPNIDFSGMDLSQAQFNF